MMKKRLADFIFSTDPLRINESQFAGKDLALRALEDFEIALEETELELQGLGILPPDGIRLTDFRKGNYSEEVLVIIEKLYKKIGEIRDYNDKLTQYEYPGVLGTSIAIDTGTLRTAIMSPQKGTLAQRRKIGDKIAADGKAYVDAIASLSPKSRGYYY